MKQLKTPTDIASLGTILSIWAHPDDESFLAAGVLATAASQGQMVVCVTATKGEAGSQDIKKWPPESLGKVRAQEMAAALKILGITQHYWLGCHDGNCAKPVQVTVVHKLIRIIKQFKPDSIITFGPEGWTGHSDHRMVSKWASLAVAQLDAAIPIYHVVGTLQQYESYLKEVDARLNIFFNIDKPPIVEARDCAILFELPPTTRALKLQALAAMPSQTELLHRLFPPEFLDKAFAIEAFVRARS